MPLDLASADALQSIIERQQSLTTLHEQSVQSRISIWAAMRESDSEALKRLVDWPAERSYYIDPLPQKISEAFADLLFSEDSTFTAAQAVEAGEKAAAQAAAKRRSALGGPVGGPVSEEAMEGADESPPPEDAAPDGDEEAEDDSDQARLDALVEANDLPSELKHAEELCSSEGEVWWRIYVDEAQMDYPIIEWSSRSHVRPYFRGRKLVAAAFYDEVFREEVEDQFRVYRWVAIYSAGHVRNLLYVGNPMQLGRSVPLSERPETENLAQDWNHEFEMLCGRIPNKLGRDRRYGISDYAGVKDLILSLNEATTIGHENARLSAKKRAVVPASALDETGRFDAGEDVLVADDDLDVELGKAASNKFAILEYSFDAEALIAYKEDIAGIILTRVGLTETFAPVTSRGAAHSGAAASGTALRVRLIPTTLAASGKARFWDDALPKVLMLTQLVDRDKFNREWVMPGEPPAVERGQPLPQDESEQITNHAAAVTAEIESRLTAVKDLHPDWTEQQVEDELSQISAELDMFGPIGKGAKGGGGGPPGDGPPAETNLPSPDEGADQPGVGVPAPTADEKP